MGSLPPYAAPHTLLSILLCLPQRKQGAELTSPQPLYLSCR